MSMSAKDAALALVVATRFASEAPTNLEQYKTKGLLKGQWKELPRSSRGYQYQQWTANLPDGTPVYLGFEDVSVDVKEKGNSRLRDPSKTKYIYTAALSLKPNPLTDHTAVRVVNMKAIGEGKELEVRNKARAKMVQLFGVDPMDHLGAL